MPQFSYIARDDKGRINRGKIDADTMDDVREDLRKKNLTVDQIIEVQSTAAKIGVNPTMPWTNTDDVKEEKQIERAIKTEKTKEKNYVPLVDTLRLFAGWLLAWYALVYILGDLQLHGGISADTPYIEALFTSPLVLRFTAGTFLFLLCTGLHKWMKGGIGKGITLTVVGVFLFVVFHLNA